MTILLFIVLSLATPSITYASHQNMVQILQTEIKHRKNRSFDSLVEEWKEKYSNQIFHPLVQIASNRKNEDTDRYVALMAASKLGGSAAVPMLTSLLKDRSWMIKAGALQALSVIQTAFTTEIILPLLQDPALVVRAEAVQAVKILKPKGAVEALLATLDSEENYHGGKAQWVPQKVLAALVELRAKESTPQLVSVLEHPRHRQDPEFIAMTLRTLEKLTGKRSNPRATLAEQIQDWKKFIHLEAQKST